MLRIYNKETGLFLRDDFTFDETTESAYEGDIQGGFYLPRFDGTEWVEGMTAEQIQAIKDAAIPAGPTLEEKIAEHDSKIVTMEEALEAIFGGV